MRCPALSFRALERKALLWETSYFSERFAHEERGIEKERLEDPKLRAELAALAERVEVQKRVLVHRDCQSQNVLLRGGKAWFVDYQGARPGSCWPAVSPAPTDTSARSPSFPRRRDTASGSH